MALKKNIIYSSVLTVSGYVFPFITFPYVTRVLGVEKLGLCNFFDSIVTYFILFSMMGMVNLAIREIAKCNGDKEKLNKTLSSLFVLNLATTIFSLFVMLCSLFFVTKFQENKEMVLIGAVKVLANFFLIEWFYKGIENFRYITFRSLLIRTLYVLAVFILVRTKDDYLLYFLLTTFMYVVNSFINFIHSRKYVVLSLKNIKIDSYLKPYIIFGAYQILTSMYTSFNVAYLGFVCNDVQVGYYSTSVKLFNILLSFYTAFTGVLMPRMSSIAAKNDENGYVHLLNKSIMVLFIIAFPIIIISEFFTSEIVTLISGSGYEGSIIPMRIVMPLVLIIGYEQILVFQVLMPLNRDRSVFVNSIIGAFVGIVFNIALVNKLGATGSAAVWLISELTVLCAAQYFSFDIIKKSTLKRVFLRKLLFAFPAIFIIILLKQFSSGLFSLILGVIIMISYYFFIEYKIEKNELVRNLVHKLLKNTKWKS